MKTIKFHFYTKKSLLYVGENFFWKKAQIIVSKHIFYNLNMKYATMIKYILHIFLKFIYVRTTTWCRENLFNFLPYSGASCRMKLFFRGRRLPIMKRDFKLMIVFQYRDISFSQDTNAFYCPHIDKIFFCDGRTVSLNWLLLSSVVFLLILHHERYTNGPRSAFFRRILKQMLLSDMFIKWSDLT